MKETKKNIPLAVATVALGIIVGFSSLILSAILDITEHYFLNFNETNRMPVNISIFPIHRFLSVFIGGAIAAIVWYLLQLHYRPVSIKNALNGKRMPLNKTMIHVVTQIFFVGTGNSIGRELAPREAGAAIAQKWGKALDRYHLFHLDSEDKRLLVAAAAGAGFAGVYIAPITGTIFCLEILYQRINARSVSVSLIMSVIATMIGSILKGFEPYYIVGSRNFSLISVPFAVILGVLLGVAGTWFKRGVAIASAHRVTNNHLFWQLPLLSLSTGIIAAFYPQIMGNGRGLAQLAMNTTTIDKQILLALLFGLFAKVIITLFTIKCGGYGGTLTPSIAAGAVIGVLLGIPYIHLFPLVTLTQCAVIGATLFLAASQQAPLMALFMLFEVCHLNFTAFIPLGIGVAISIGISKWLQGATKE
ncbi:chloride channel protein [Limosilactobacillus sp. STM2_1]|uniref:Chloride channel protein n=1 Tax=Limosilactobacillus rudii TaxID=2759755 RepID=A0A7W3UMG3_9LACO|nr:chloride channel protein [Limosilactobacillus rudii]MBB1078913.1 chloride channel protein [Limosilactobacillus rudii]MBB1098211.1 chloride channel protein [Limosilactobacillus rudii]MCD7135674.1 chloride channel protein [Limosilactobacillus rudii]